MKYLKRFEDNIDCKDGDYAIFKYTDENYAYHYKFTKELKDFINNNIGQIIIASKDPNDWVSVRYEDIPDSIQHKFHSGDSSILLHKKNLVATSETDEDLKIKKNAHKYNL